MICRGFVTYFPNEAKLDNIGYVKRFGFFMSLESVGGSRHNNHADGSVPWLISSGAANA